MKHLQKTLKLNWILILQKDLVFEEPTILFYCEFYSVCVVYCELKPKNCFWKKVIKSHVKQHCLILSCYFGRGNSSPSFKKIELDIPIRLFIYYLAINASPNNFSFPNLYHLCWQKGEHIVIVWRRPKKVYAA